MWKNRDLWETMKDCGRLQSILGKQKKLWEKTEGEHKGLRNSTGDLRRPQRMRESNKLWENMEDCGRAQRIMGKRKHYRKAQDYGRTWRTVGENRIAVEK